MAMIHKFTDGVPVEQSALDQVEALSRLPFVHSIAVMPDAHAGKGSTVGTVIGTIGAVIPAGVSVDIGCGVDAVKTYFTASDLPENLRVVRDRIESMIPVGGPGIKGSWAEARFGEAPTRVQAIWSHMLGRYRDLADQHPKIGGYGCEQLGTLGTGNHFIEVCLDESDSVWLMVHSGSRGIGNRIGSYFIERAKDEMRRWFINLPDTDLAYLPEGSLYYDDYMAAVSFAQDFARINRQVIVEHALQALSYALGRQCVETLAAVSCHHNYVAMERQFGREMLVTRKGAISAKSGELGIIPMSMGSPSYIVRGKGNFQSMTSSSHGAGRVMSRTAARKIFTVEDHIRDTSHVECRKDSDVIDETPRAYKDPKAVMKAQESLTEIVATLRQVVCVKG